MDMNGFIGTHVGSFPAISMLNRRLQTLRKGMTVLVGEIFTFERFSGGHDLDKVLVEHSPGVHQRSKRDSGRFYSWCKRGGEDPPGAMGLLEQL